MLLSLGRTHGEPESEGGNIRLNVKLTRMELGSLVDATPETVIRLLSDFQSLGYVKLKGKQIILRDESGLLQESGLDS